MDIPSIYCFPESDMLCLKISCFYVNIMCNVHEHIVMLIKTIVSFVLGGASRPRRGWFLKRMFLQRDLAFQKEGANVLIARCFYSTYLV